MPQTAYQALGQGGNGLPISTSASTLGLGERRVNPEERRMLSQTATQEYQQHPPLLQHSATREHLPKQKLPVLVQLPCRQEECHRPCLLQRGFQNFT